MGSVVLSQGYGWMFVATDEDQIPASGRGKPPCGNAAPLGRPSGCTTEGKMFDPMEGVDVSCRVDWLRFTGGPECLEKVKRFLETATASRGETQRGFSFFRSSTLYKGGAVLCTDHYGAEGPTGRCQVELSGSVLGAMDAEEVQRWSDTFVEFGMRATRSDVAVDLRGPAGSFVSQILDRLEAAAKRGELVGARKWEPVIKYDSQGVCERQVRFGVRGSDGSGRFLRVYDKGLETGEAAEGEWVRFEVEFSDDCAKSVVHALLAAWHHWDSRGAVEETIRDVVFGSIDYREVTGTKRLSKRPRCGWWQEFTDAVGSARIRIKARRVAATAVGMGRWVGNINRSLTAIALGMGITVAEVLTFFGGNVTVTSKMVAKSMEAPVQHLAAAYRGEEWAAGPLVERLNV